MKPRFPRLISALTLSVGTVMFFSVHNAPAQNQERLNNTMIEACAQSETRKGNRILECIGRFSKPCRAREDNASPVMQEECLEHEFVLWDQHLRKQVKSLKSAIPAGEAHEHFKTSHDIWVKFRQAECRLPYILLPQGFTPKQLGLDCAIRLTARRVADIQSLKRILQKK